MSDQRSTTAKSEKFKKCQTEKLKKCKERSITPRRKYSAIRRRHVKGEIHEINASKADKVHDDGHLLPSKSDVEQLDFSGLDDDYLQEMGFATAGGWKSTMNNTKDIKKDPLRFLVNEREAFVRQDNANISSRRTLRHMREGRNTEKTTKVMKKQKISQKKTLRPHSLENHNFNADRRFDFSKKSRAASAVDSRVHTLQNANESSNYPDSALGQRQKTKHPDRTMSATSDDARLHVPVPKTITCKYHETCKDSSYRATPKKLVVSTEKKKESLFMTKPIVMGNEKKRPVTPEYTSKYHTECKQSKHPLVQTKSFHYEGKPLPYGGPLHPYTCPKRNVCNLYESRMREKARITDYKSRVQNFARKYCLRCNAIYEDGICRHELGCKDYPGKKIKSRDALMESKYKLAQARGATKKDQVCSCNYEKEITPKEVDAAFAEKDGDHNFVVQADAQDRTRCQIVIRRTLLFPSNSLSIKLLIVQLDILDLPEERRATRPDVRDGSSPVGDNIQQQSLKAGYSGNPEENTGQGGAKERPQSSANQKNVSIFSSTEGLGKRRQFLKVDGKDINISVNIQSNDFPAQKNDATTNLAATKRLNWSAGSQQLVCPVILKGRMVTDACICPSEPNMILTLHTKIDHGHGKLPCKLICAWNINNLRKPSRILGEAEKVTCMCFSPVSPAFAFAGMLDGSVAVWNIEKPSLNNTIIKVKTDTFVVYNPFFRTPHSNEDNGHTSCVLSIVGIKPPPSSSSGDVSQTENFQVATVEAAGVIIIWQVTNSSSDSARMISFGSSDRTTVRMIMNLQVSLIHQSADIMQQVPLGTLILQLNSIAGTDVTGDGSYSISSVQYHAGASIGKSAQVQCISFSPFNSMFFLAGYWDGTVFLCHVEKTEPILCFNSEENDKKPVVKAEWSPTRPAVFFVLKKNSNLRIYDLLVDKQYPLHTVQSEEGPFSTMVLSHNNSRSSYAYLPSLSLLLSTIKGTTEIHTLDESLAMQGDVKEMKFLKSLLEEE